MPQAAARPAKAATENERTDERDVQSRTVGLYLKGCANGLETKWREHDGRASWETKLGHHTGRPELRQSSSRLFNRLPVVYQSFTSRLFSRLPVVYSVLYSNHELTHVQLRKNISLLLLHNSHSALSRVQLL